MRVLLTALLVIAIAGIANAAPMHLNENIYTQNLQHSPSGNFVMDASLNKHANAKKFLSDDEKIMDQAEDLEAVMISTMVEPMFPKDDGSGIYGGGHGSDIYRMMMIQQYGKILSKSNGLGVAENIAKRLQNKKEASQ